MEQPKGEGSREFEDVSMRHPSTPGGQLFDGKADFFADVERRRT